jgi:hypothetical protein
MESGRRAKVRSTCSVHFGKDSIFSGSHASLIVINHSQSISSKRRSNMILCIQVALDFSDEHSGIDRLVQFQNVHH